MSSDDTDYSVPFLSPRSMHDGLEVGGIRGDSDFFAEEVEASTLSVLMRAVAPCFLDPRGFLVKGVGASACGAPEIPPFTSDGTVLEGYR
jgi:hypothetical protein